jgi:Cd2+/Zn2+-exporting ATPase
VAFLPPLVYADQALNVWVYRALVMLVVSCPCALVISIPLGYFGGIGGASRKGILIKGANFLDALLKLDTVVFDKTGTLTKGVFKVTEIVALNGYSKEELLSFAARAEVHSNHPIAESIRNAYTKKFAEVETVIVEELPGQGIRSSINGMEVLLGNDNLLHKENIDHPVCDLKSTVVHLAVNKKYAGYIVISDEIKPESYGLADELKSLGITQTIMLTGDNKTAADEIGRQLKIDKIYAELLPEDKLQIMEELLTTKSPDRTIAFVGDGINDAPVIARADIGMAMGGIGSDSAIEAADIVLMEDNPRKAAEAIRIAHKTRNIVWQNIIFAMAVKLFFIIAGTMGLASMWEAVFGDMGVALIAILNSTRMLKSLN